MIPFIEINSINKFNNLKEETKKQINNMYQEISKKNLIISEEDCIYKIYEIACDIKPEVIFINIFQNIQIPKRLTKDFLTQLLDISIILKGLAIKLDIPIIITVNLSRYLKDHKFDQYNLSNLYNAGISPHHSDVVIFCKNETNKIQINIIKNKNGEENKKFHYI